MLQRHANSSSTIRRWGIKRDNPLIYSLLEMKHLNPASQVLESLTYTYDPAGNRTGVNRPSVTLPLPVQVTTTSYNDANQMLTFDDKAITYDENGNMTSVTNACGTSTYTWDARNRLVGITGFRSDCTALSASFKYDALGRTIEKTVNGKTTRYLYDGLDIVREIENSLPTVNYIRPMNIDEQLASVEASGRVRKTKSGTLPIYANCLSFPLAFLLPSGG